MRVCFLAFSDSFAYYLLIRILGPIFYWVVYLLLLNLWERLSLGIVAIFLSYHLSLWCTLQHEIFHLICLIFFFVVSLSFFREVLDLGFSFYTWYYIRVQLCFVPS